MLPLSYKQCGSNYIEHKGNQEIFRNGNVVASEREIYHMLKLVFIFFEVRLLLVAKMHFSAASVHSDTFIAFYTDILLFLQSKLDNQHLL